MTNDEMTDFIFLENADPKGDIAFVFGTWNAWNDSVAKSAKLYKAGLVPKVIVSGGKNERTGEIEGDKMAEELMLLGVKKEDILIENKSTNTLENVLFSKEVIEKEIGLGNIKIITAVAKNYHTRRALMTLKKHMPENIILKVVSVVSAYYGFTKADWQDSDIGKKKVFEEVEKIKKYLAKGDLAEL